MSRPNLAIQGLKGYSTAHGDEVGHIVEMVGRDVIDRESFLVVKDAHGGSHLGNLIVIQERHDQVGDSEAIAIGTRAGLTRSLAKQSHQTMQEGQEQNLGRSNRARTDTIVVAQVLRVGIVAQLLLVEHVAPGTEAAGDLTLVGAQVGKEGDVALIKGEVAADQLIETLHGLRSPGRIP